MLFSPYQTIAISNTKNQWLAAKNFVLDDISTNSAVIDGEEKAIPLWELGHKKSAPCQGRAT